LDFIIPANQIWIGFDNIVFNFFATFCSVLGLQITALKSLIQWTFSNRLQSVAARGENGGEGCKISSLVEHTGLSPWLCL